MVGMHLLQWMHKPVGRLAPLPPADQIGLSQQGPGHGHEGESLGQRTLDRLQPVHPAEQDEGQGRARRGTGGRRAGSRPPRTGSPAGTSSPPPGTRPAAGRAGWRRTRAGAPRPGTGTSGWTASCPRSARGRRVPPSDSSMRANSMLSSSQNPPGHPVGHVELGRDRHLVTHRLLHRVDHLARETGPGWPGSRPTGRSGG